MVLTAVLTRSKLVPLTTVRPVTTDVSPNNVIRPRPAKTVGTKPYSPPRRTINHRPSPPASNFPPKVTTFKTSKVNVVKGVQGHWGNPQHALKDKGVIDSRCSRHMTGNMSYLSDFEEINSGYVAFGGNLKGGKISGKGKIRTSKLDFDDVYFIKELKFNLFSISQMCDKKCSVLFTDSECIFLSPEFKLPDEIQVLLRVPRENNMYNVDLNNIVPSRDLTCLFAKETLDESNLWHRRLGHISFKTMNKLVKGNLVRGLPSKVFKNNHTCVACKKRKQHRASCKTKPVSSVSQPLQRFTWVFFLATKDETSPILKTFINGIENQLSLKVKIIRSDNRAEFKNQDLNQFCGMQGIKREFSVPRTPQQNGIAKRVLVTKPHNKTSYELFLGRTPSISFMRPFGYPVTILNTLDPLGKFDGKADEGFLVGYSINSSGPTWLFDIDTLTKSMIHQPVTAGNQSNPNADPQNIDGDATFEVKEPELKGRKPKEAKGKSPVKLSTGYRNLSVKFEDFSDNSINEVNAASTPVLAVRQILTNSTNTFSAVALEDITYFDDEEDVGAKADFSNLETTIIVTTQTRSMTRMVKDQGRLTQINNEDFHTCMFACFLSQEEPKRVHQALKDPSWIEAMQEELLQFKMQKEEGINYEEVFDLVARIEAIRLFIAYASFMGFMVYQMDVKSDFLYETIKEEVYVCQPPGFEDPDYPDKVYKVVKALYGLHQAPRAWYETLANYLLENGFQRRKIDQTLLIKKQKVAYSDSDYAGASLDRKSTIRGCQFLGYRLISWQCKKQTVVATSSNEAEYVAAASCYAQVNDVVGLQALIDRKKVIITEATVREALRLDDAESIDCLPSEEIFTELSRMGVGKGFSGVETPLFEGMIVPQQAAADVDVVNNDVVAADVPAADAEPTPPSPPPTTPPPPPQELPSTSQVVPTPPPSPIAQPSSHPQKQPSQPTTVSMDLLQSLLETCTTLTRRVENLEQDKIAQALKILKVKKRVRKLQKKKKLKASGLKRLQKVGTAQRIESSADAEVNAEKDAKVVEKDADVQGRPKESQAQIYKIDLEHADKVLSMQDDVKEPSELQEAIEVVTTAKVMTEVVTAATTTITVAAPITAATITIVSTAARRRKEVVIGDPEETAAPSIIIHTEPKSKDKGKWIMVEEPKPLKKQA
uniref:Integrase catalytic domain-containing protein n=1 Tax=Tanacetum cinerariifolium TaxID=118510 RepID=A0A6L2KKY6_TANCI|nr:hypothetical protein [Tanacetum cinerariifolium]